MAAAAARAAGGRAVRLLWAGAINQLPWRACLKMHFLLLQFSWSAIIEVGVTELTSCYNEEMAF